MGFLGDLGGLVVADLRIQGGDEHEGVLHVFADIGLDGFDAAGATLVKADAAIADQAGAGQEIIDPYGLEGVEVEEPGSLSGMSISPMPLRGPEESMRISLAIFMRLTATVFRAPWASTMASWAARASNLFSAVTKGRPVRVAIFCATFSA